MSKPKPICILYMEDDVGLARLFQKKLRRAGYQVDIAHDGAEGLALYRANNYDVVAVDHKMPVHDGLEVIRILASEGPLPPTLMITGAGNEKIAIEAMKLGAGDYIVKDVEGGYLELLPSVIEQILNQRQLVEEKRQALNSLQQLNRNLSLLNLVGQKLAALLDLQEIMTLLMEAVTETIGAEGTSVWLKEETGKGDLVCHATFRQNQSHAPAHGPRLAAGEGIVGRVVQQGQSLILPTPSENSDDAPDIDVKLDESSTSLLAVPLRARDTVIGALEVVNKQSSPFDADDQSLVETLAASAAIAIDNARLVETLRRQTVELKARNEELDAFAHTVAHDLKTPLGPLMGLSEMLDMYYETMPEDTIKQGLHAIKRNGRKMSNIIDELLLLAQMHDTDIELMPLDMRNILEEAQQRLSYMIHENEVEIILPDTWPEALGYGPWIEEVWVNYLSNAIKYGGEPPRLELGATPQPDGMIRFWVHDNGSGIKPEEQEMLFIPFTQLDKIRAEGHGLGLSIVRRIVEKLGGEVGVESNGLPNQGSTFTFTLPPARDIPPV